MVPFYSLVRLRHFAMIAGLAVVFASVADPSDATSLSPLGDEIRDLDASDLKMLRESSREVLEKNVVGGLASWTNKETGHSGSASLLRSFEVNGKRCGAVAHFLVAGGSTHFVLPFCEHERGSWKISF
jgi:surface antigen